MAQNDMNVANQGFPAFRADLNDQLEALVTNSSGSTAPATTFPHQWWLDTSTTPTTLRQRNAANDAWIVVGLLNQSANTFNVPVAQGGTGAATAGGARTNIGALAAANPEYTGTLTGGTGVVNLGSGQFYKDASGNVGIGTSTIGSNGVSLSAGNNIGWSQSAGESVPNIFRQASSAATVVANGYRYTATANGFASSFGSSFAKSAIALNEGTVRFYTDAAETTAAGTDVTPTERMRIASNGQQSSVIPGGSVLYPEFKCRAWVNFNGTITTGNIRASGNVSSVTRTATGLFTVNLTTAMPDENYSVVATTELAGQLPVVRLDSLPTSSSFGLVCNRTSDGAFVNPTAMLAALFR